MVLTLNEAVTLSRCLTSVMWADEIVVVDSGSSDDTVAVATSCGARVYLHVQDGPFQISEQRNWALDNTAIGSDWVMFLDADEEVGALLAAKIRDALANAGGTDCFELTPRYWFFGRWMKRCLGYPNWHPRIVRLSGVRFQGGVWEHVDEGTVVTRIDVPYEHHGNAKGFRDWLERHDRYSSWDAASVVDYLQSRDDRAFRTARKIGLRRFAARVWWARPMLRFLSMFVLRGGFRDGWPAILFCLRYAVYEYMTVEKIVERRRRAAGQQL